MERMRLTPRPQTQMMRIPLEMSPMYREKVLDTVFQSSVKALAALCEKEKEGSDKHPVQS